MSLKDINFKIQYRSDNDREMIDEFYIPVLNEALIYKRAVGFFSSSSLISISKGISTLLFNGGKMYLIVSQRLSKEDIEAIEKGYLTRKEAVENSIINNFLDTEDKIICERYNYLAHLISRNKLDIKIAVTKNNNASMYHEKIGIVSDEFNNKIAFTGSLNESEFSYLQNFESIDVFCSWNNYMDCERVRKKEEDFDNMWTNNTNNLEIYNFPEALKRKILQYKKNEITKEENLINYEGKPMIKDVEPDTNIPKIPSWLKIREYQNEAFNEWKKNGFVGLLNMATGTGKTLTALMSMTNLYSELEEKKLLVVIVCPYTHLVEQWKEDVEEFNIDPIIAYSDNKYVGWNKKISKLLFRIKLGMEKFGCILTTNSTYKSEKFQSEIAKSDNEVLIIVDEAHNAGADEFSKFLLEKFKYRLALSATPKRNNDENGTNKIFSYFGEEVYTFTLERAIEEGFLTRYYYYPQIIYLTAEERCEYEKLTKRILKFIDSKTGKLKMNSTVESLLIKRSRIVAGAENKIYKLKELMRDKKSDNYNLIYCGATGTNIADDNRIVRQIDAVSNLLGNDFGMKVARFTSEETMEERKKIIDNFSDGKSLQAIIAIKCLDEGVNIPSIKNAYILASSTNPREFIQRRGRVLRKFEGKEYAYIYDFITLPRESSEILAARDSQLKSDLSLIKKELKRVKEFASLAENKISAMNDIKDIVDFYNSLISD